jgi:acetyl-CoA carboxylase, biotin carboxylase subunit
MISKILIANRGEIALRIIRSARELGIKTVAVYSEADRQSLHAFLADEKVCIGPAKASESYLNIANILSAVEITGADAIHPGYGFLAENAKFAEICRTHGITFIGPPPDIIRLMGDKDKARQAMRKAGLPILPGSDQVIEDLAEAKKTAQKIGFPVIIKAAAGGGGKGMRICRSSAQLEEQLPIAQGEAKAAFNDPSLYIEKFVSGARHIEIQVIGDKNGRVTAFGERECSVQRKYQKLIEETPSPFIDEKIRKRIIREVEDAASKVGYQSLGTFEFLVDENRKFYFMEANARVQVEHPITEMVYGINLIKAQIKFAAGEKYNFPEPLEMRGHSIECRINAEDPQTFVPSPGKIDFLVLPGGEGIRVDSAAYGGWTVPPDYDSLVAKIIAYAPTRELAIRKMRAALEMTTIVGIKTNIPLHLSVLSDTDFLSGKYDTQFMEGHLANIKPPALCCEEFATAPSSGLLVPVDRDHERPPVVLDDVLVDPQVQAPPDGGQDLAFGPDVKDGDDLVPDLLPRVLVHPNGDELGDLADEGPDVPVLDRLLDGHEVEAVRAAVGGRVAALEGDPAVAWNVQASPWRTSIPVSTQPASAGTASVLTRPSSTTWAQAEAARRARRKTLSLVIRSLLSRDRRTRGEDVEHGGVDQAVGGRDAGRRELEIPPLDVRDAPAGLRHEQRTGGDIPGVELELPEPVEPAAGDIGQVQGRRPAAPDGLGPDDEPAPMIQVVDRARPDVVGEARGQKAPAQVVDAGGPDGGLVEKGPPPGDGPEHLLPHRVVDESEDDPALALEGRGDAEDREGVGVVRRAVERIDDPPEGRRARPGESLLGQKAVAGKRGGQAPDEDLLGAGVEGRDQVDRPLERNFRPPVEVRPEVEAGLPDGGFGDLPESFEVVHRDLSYQLPGPEANREPFSRPSVV